MMHGGDAAAFAAATAPGYAAPKVPSPAPMNMNAAAMPAAMDAMNAPWPPHQQQQQQHMYASSYGGGIGGGGAPGGGSYAQPGPPGPHQPGPHGPHQSGPQQPGGQSGPDPTYHLLM
jgi:hypothetical protein